MNIKKCLEFAIFILVLIGLFIFGLYNPTIIGFVTYQSTEHEKIWDFSNAAEYSYDDSLINLSNGARLMPNIEVVKIEDYSYESYDIISALYNYEDKTSEVNSKDDETLTVDKSKKLNVIFEHELNNGDIISIYIKRSDNSNIYLCDYNTSCISPWYGLKYYNGHEGWYNITISGLNNTTDRFNIDPNHVKIDYIYANRFVNNSYNIFNITYPKYASIDTQDLIVNNVKWDLLIKNEELNGQNINYYYSTDSGNSWNLINDSNLSYINSNAIRLRANLTSDSTNTPVLNLLSLKYITSVACQEDWACASWEPEICPKNGTQTRVCFDLNECGSEDNKPETSINCNYTCIENWNLYYSECRDDDTMFLYYTDGEGCGTINSLPANNGTILSCDYCLPNWVCVIYDKCNVNNKIKECNEVADTNYCYELTGLNSDNIIPNLSESCTEFVSNLSVENNILNYNFYYNNNYSLNIELNNSNIFTNLELKNTITNGSVSIINYDNNIKNKSAGTGLKYFEIDADSHIKNNLNSNKIIIYYKDEEINNNNLDEDTLKIYYYNESNEWQELNSTLNKTGKYIEIILDHLSYYGIFGEEKQQAPSSSSGGGSGGGGGGGGWGGGYILPEPKENKETVKEEIRNYEIESSIDKSISFIDNNKYIFNIKNKGDKIDKIELSLNNNIVRLSNNLIENLDKENNIELSLITDPILTRTKSNLLIQGFAAKIVEDKIKDISIQLNILGISEDKIVVNKTIPLTAKVIVFDKISNEKILPYNIIIIGLLVISILFISKFLKFKFEIKK